MLWTNQTKFGMWSKDRGVPVKKRESWSLFSLAVLGLYNFNHSCWPHGRHLLAVSGSALVNGYSGDPWGQDAERIFPRWK